MADLAAAARDAAGYADRWLAFRREWLHLPGDERLLGAAWQRSMRRPAFDVDEHDAEAGRYGLGFELRTVHGRRTFGHGGGYPGHATRLTVVPEDRLSVAVCTNAVDGPARPLADGLVALPVLAAAEPDGAPVDATVDRYCGRYATLFGVDDVVRLGRRLLVLDPAADDPSAAYVALEPDGPHTFRVVRTAGYGAYGERVRFTLDDDGRVVSARLFGGVTCWPAERMTASSPVATRSGSATSRRAIGPGRADYGVIRAPRRAAYASRAAGSSPSGGTRTRAGRPSRRWAIAVLSARTTSACCQWRGMRSTGTWTCRTACVPRRAGSRRPQTVELR
jgi:hypothetical protein